MKLNLIAFLFGAILLAVAILGGGFELKELKVPKVSWFPRLISAFVGMFFVVVGIGLETPPIDPPPPITSPSTEQSPKVSTEKEQELSRQLEKERQSRENAEQELERLKSEKARVAQTIRNEAGTNSDQALNQLLNEIEQAKASQQSNGLHGVIKITWLDINQIGFVIMNGSHGILRTSYSNSTGNVEIVDQDLSLTSYQGKPYLVGSNPRFAGTTTIHSQYNPDVFQLQQNPGNGLNYIDAVCDTNLVCSRIKTESLF
jgi:hypothetical protein